MYKMMLLPDGTAVLDGDDPLSGFVRERGLCCDLMVRASIMPHLKPGDWVVDGGAANGDHTIGYLEAVGPSGRVFAFEPFPELFKCLKHNCPTAVAYEFILWNKRTQLFLHVSEKNGSAGWVSESDVPTASGDHVYGPIHTVVLDELLFQKLDLVKLDLEGAGFFALQGMAETVNRLRPKLVLEMDPGLHARYGLTHRDIYDLLKSWNYDHRSICGNPDPECEACDILCWPR
jgi:FkbM family methyltransferase